ncbi:pentapeptide repeat-containing protein [Streptomyces sp. NPDC127077]|uniref:pentapeptide repeat-containing protein n=1 Tax=Streptomyces sp. NPDC127077 TaxID=3347131 RepID=UPI00365E9843
MLDPDRTSYLTSLTPGADIDHRGTPFTALLLDDLLNALRDPTTGNPHFGATTFGSARFSDHARFDRAQFSRDARFDGVQFTGNAEFSRARFSGAAWFDGVQFSAHAGFGGAQFCAHATFAEAQFFGEAEFGSSQFSNHAGFSEARFSRDAKFEAARFSPHGVFSSAQFLGNARFGGAQFSGGAVFDRAQFSGDARFGRAKVSRDAVFDRAQFSGHAEFEGAQFSGHARFRGAQFDDAVRFDGTRFDDDARFDGARFEGVPVLGPLVCTGRMILSGAMFRLPVTLELAARELECERTRWESTATVRVRYATVDLSHAVLSAPVAVIAYPTPFNPRGLPVGEDGLTGDGRVHIASVQGVDASHLVLTDTDLTDCLFSEAFHLDQIRLEGRTAFAPAPTGWHRRGILPIRFTPRRTLAEEHHWRTHTAASGRWRTGPHPNDPARTPDPEDVAALYRQLRKAFEDGKNEPGAADFYYGECEMRRHDTTDTPKSERRLLWGYWLLSGYGLRASRAFTWLLAAMSLTVLLLMGFGLPTHDPDPATTGSLHGSQISLHTTTPDPALHGGWQKRMTWPRTEKATRVAINSVIFRSSGQNLTTAGTYIEMISRLLEPTLLALGLLAVRGRIKR